MKETKIGNGYRVLIACEYSGVIRSAFEKKGWEAWSCDLLPSDSAGNHYQGDVRNLLTQHWDLLIGCPPCQFISSAGLFLCNIETYGIKAIERIRNRNKAVEFFFDLYQAPVKHICLENPLGYVSSSILKPTQIIHPYYFGERQMKRTALWLRNLPPLEYRLQHDLFGEKTASEYPEPVEINIRKKTGKIVNRYYVDGRVNGKIKSAHERAGFFKSVAKAMADQWSKVIIKK